MTIELRRSRLSRARLLLTQRPCDREHVNRSQPEQVEAYGGAADWRVDGTELHLALDRSRIAKQATEPRVHQRLQLGAWRRSDGPSGRERGGTASQHDGDAMRERRATDEAQ